MKPFARTLTTLTCAAAAAIADLPALADGIGGSGVVNYFHSVVIDGVHYQTDNAVIRINGRPAAEADLKVGYHVSYRADGETLEAWSMDYYDTVAARVESVRIDDEDMQSARISIMNQTVVTNANTWLHGVTLDELRPGMALAISAEWLPDGSLLASSVDAVARVEDVLTGPVSRIDGTTLIIGGVRVDAGNIGLDVHGVRVEPGEWVHALGHYDDAGTLYATRLVREADRDLHDLQSTIEGVLIRKRGTWWIRDVALELAGVDARNLVAGARVTATGTLTPDGVLVATEVRVAKRSHDRVDGVIEAVDGAGAAIFVDGVRVTIDERTSLRDDRDGYRWLGPEDLSAFDLVSVIVEEVDGELRASKVTRARELRRVLRARVRDANWWRGPQLLAKRHAKAYEAREAIYDGRRVPAWKLRFLVKAGDALTLRFDDHGNVARAVVRSRSGE